MDELGFIEVFRSSDNFGEGSKIRKMILPCVGETNANTVVLLTLTRDAENPNGLQRKDITLKGCGNALYNQISGSLYLIL